ncbi:MAG: hypothetical protein MI674_01060, partial [Cytophagales bacterium]|nr:hypothetical protein [Cytophagales bacterium]
MCVFIGGHMPLTSGSNVGSPEMLAKEMSVSKQFFFVVVRHAAQNLASALRIAVIQVNTVGQPYIVMLPDAWK